MYLQNIDGFKKEYNGLYELELYREKIISYIDNFNLGSIEIKSSKTILHETYFH